MKMAIKQLAVADGRSMSSYVNLVCRAHAEAAGELPVLHKKPPKAKG
jgi:hypothetical protein